MQGIDGNSASLLTRNSFCHQLQNRGVATGSKVRLRNDRDVAQLQNRRAVDRVQGAFPQLRGISLVAQPAALPGRYRSTVL
jgi:hypothetical protein